MSKYGEWAEKELYTEGNNDLDIDSAAAMGWEACKSEILKLLKSNIQYHFTKEGFESQYLQTKVIKDIEELL